MFSSLAAPLWLATSSPIAMDLPPQPLLAQPMLAQAAAEQQVPPAQPQPEDNAPIEDTPPTQDGVLSEDEDAAEGAAEPQADGTIVVTGSSDVIKRDPLVAINEVSFELTQSVDQAVVGPIANAYEDGLPKPVRKGLRNFFRNLLEPVNFLNYLLQFKPGKAFETLGRFAINTTVGIGGLIDVAKREPFNLPYRRNGFANTLGYYGVGPGPFLMVPLVGATSLRDLIGNLLDQAFLPTVVGKPFNTPYYAIPAFTVNSLEFRIDFDEKLTEIRESDDPYFALRETYLCSREADIAWLKNRPPPRDCSIEALMAESAPLVGIGTDLTPEQLEAAASGQMPEPQIAPEAVPATAPVAPVAPPAIVYISEEVIQPLPQ